MAALTKADLPGADLDRRTVVPGKIGVAGRAPKAAKSLAARIGLPHKEAWSAGLAAVDPGLFKLSGAEVRPLRSKAEVAALVADLAAAGLPAAKRADLETYLIKQIRSPEGMVTTARPARMRRACAVMSVFREVEVDLAGAVSYHVHVEEMVDLSAGGGGRALLEAFARQAEADLAVLAHRLADLGRDTEVEILCESNNDDTHGAVEAFSEAAQKALERIAANPEFAAATDGVRFGEPNHYRF